MTTTIRTVLGDRPAASLGRTDYHEHLFQSTPLLPGEDLDDEAAGGAEAAALAGSGFAAMVDTTPIGLGRRPEAVARISAETGLVVIASTGAHRDDHYPAGHWLLDLDEDQLADLFCRDIADWMPVCDLPDGGGIACTADGDLVRAGVIKTGVDYWRITDFEHRVLAAAAAGRHRTGAAIMVHLEHGSAAFEVLDEFAKLDVDPSAVALAHVDRNPDPGLHAELAATGAYLGYDGFARHQRWPDSTLLECLLAVAESGGAERLLIGGDVARRSRYRAYGGMPGLAYLGERVLPRLQQLGGANLADTVLTSNPARWLGRDHASPGESPKRSPEQSPEQPSPEQGES